MLNIPRHTVGHYHQTNPSKLEDFFSVLNYSKCDN